LEGFPDARRKEITLPRLAKHSAGVPRKDRTRALKHPVHFSYSSLDVFRD